jgi:hypothetical protein
VNQIKRILVPIAIGVILLAYQNCAQPNQIDPQDQSAWDSTGQRYIVFSTAGTQEWTVPAGVSSLKVTVIGGGGPGHVISQGTSGGTTSVTDVSSSGCAIGATGGAASVCTLNQVTGLYDTCTAGTPGTVEGGTAIPYGTPIQYAQPSYGSGPAGNNGGQGSAVCTVAANEVLTVTVGAGGNAGAADTLQCSANGFCPINGNNGAVIIQW